MTIDYYMQVKQQLKEHFSEFVNAHAFAECVEYYYYLEGCSAEDALLFLIYMVERYVEEFECDFYDHIGCMVFHDGNNSMLFLLLKAQLATTNDNAKEYYQVLIDGLVVGLQYTARNGFFYDEKYLAVLREKISSNLL